MHLVSGIPDHARQAMAVLRCGQALRLHRADGHEPRRSAGHRRGPEELGQELHDDGDRRLHPAVPLCPGAREAGPFRAHPVPARGALPGHGALAAVLGRPAAHVVRHPRRQPAAGPGRDAGRAGALFRLRPDARGAAAALRQSLSGGDGHLPAGDAGPVRRGDAHAVPLRPALHGELHRLRRGRLLRVADGGRGSRCSFA